MGDSTRGPRITGAEPRPGSGDRVEPEFLVVGQITKPHGTKGEVFVWPLTEHPDQIFADGEELILGDTEGEIGEASVHLVVEGRRPFKRGFLVRWEGFPDRTAVASLSGRYLLVPADRIAPLEEGEVHYHQLLDMEVVTVEGEVVGRVREVYETEPAHLLEVKGGDRLHLIPFTKEIVREIDLRGGRLVIEPPAGLLEL